jgi:wyosine [tRNA(Phe)-imidazoG37] synthetase (radical SAM superfamily)
LKYVFGPVPSRRLGRSLGIDPIPLKTCNWNCIYCQLGRTRPVVNRRKEYIAPELILDQVAHFLDEHDHADIDWVTFVGSGEPLLNAGLGWMIQEVKALSDIPVAVITNGTLLHMPTVRQELLAADAVLPSLDAGTAELYRKINRPHARVPFDLHLQGLIDFGQEYEGTLWPEVMLIHNVNDTEDALTDLASALQKIKPDCIHLNVPSRPPAETWVQPASEEGVIRAMAILGDIAKVVHPTDGKYERGAEINSLDSILAIIQRHPMREDEVLRTLAQWESENAQQTFDQIAASGKIQIVKRHGVCFWCSVDSYYPDNTNNKPRKRAQIEGIK